LKLRAFILILITMSLGIELKAQSSALDLSCQDFEKVFEFVRKEHLRFRVMAEQEYLELFKKAFRAIPDTMRNRGYLMMAAQFENEKEDLLKKAMAQSSLQGFCRSLGSSLTQAMFLKAFVSELDPYSEFYLSDESQRKSSVVDGHFVGVGIATKNADPFLEITEVVDGGPSEGKLKVGDRITHIDGYPVRGLRGEELKIRIRGALHTDVKFSVLRSSEPISLDVVVNRDHVYQQSVSYRWMEKGVLQIRIHRFFVQTAGQIRDILMKEKSKMKALVLDLRDNPGGLLQSARDVVDLFVGSGVVVYLRGEYDDQLWALHGGAVLGTPMLVLINERTASAAEIVAGALQDYGRALLVGRQTFGKSCVQNIYETQSAIGTAYPGGLKITTLWYYLPSGRSAKSIIPDFAVPLAADETNTERIHMPYEMPSQIEVFPISKTKRAAKIKSLMGEIRPKLQASSESEKLSLELIKYLLAER